jgi:DNA-binding YbaB/EbfC family protein
MFDMAKMMAQAKKVQDKMGKIQEDLEKLEVTGKSANGLVSVTCNGKFEFQAVTIDPAFLTSSSAEQVQVSVLEALQNATEQIVNQTQEQMASLTAGLNIPGLKLPF